MKRIVAYVPDLMDRSRITAAGGAEITFVARPEDLPAAAAGADLAVLDLGRPGVLEQVSKLPVPSIGFASHVDRPLMAAATEAGTERVLARSAFFSRLQELLG